MTLPAHILAAEVPDTQWEEIPIEQQLKFSPLDLSSHEVTNTGRRFNRYNGEYREIEASEAAYKYAAFGECVARYTHGIHRFNQVTIIYARLSKPIPAHAS